MPELAKSIAKGLLREPARRVIRQWWENLRDWIEVFVFRFYFFATRTPGPMFCCISALRPETIFSAPPCCTNGASAGAAG
jgi:hypothetical protein